ncbi:MAG: hypothetical protein ABIK56_01395 [candidate division WOR-3 bacterium]
MNKLPKNLIIGDDLFHEELRTIFPWKKVEKLINPKIKYWRCI